MKNEYDTSILIKNMESYKKLVDKHNKKIKEMPLENNSDKKDSYDLKMDNKKMSTSEKQ